MNFYKHYIGDFQRDTGHLSLTQRGAYRALMDHYYATEKPLPNDHAALCRIAGALDMNERDAVRVAMGFFEPCESGLMHTRIEVELHKAGEVSSTNRDIALAREAKRRAARTEHEQSTKRAQSVAPALHEQSTNQTPDTNTLSSASLQKEKPARKRAAAAQLVSVDAMVAEGVNSQHAADWLAARKVKDLPLTQTAWQLTKDEASKAGLTPAEAIKTAAGNSWAGFKASWLQERSVPRAATTASRHAGFGAKDYREGVTADGHIA